MFDLKFTIMGGSLRMKKSAFLKEMLGKDGSLRHLLDWRNTGDFSKKHPAVSEPDADGYVTIQFNYLTHIELGEEYDTYLKSLKEKYKDEIKGKIACRGSYGTLFNFTLDLNGDEVRIVH